MEWARSEHAGEYRLENIKDCLKDRENEEGHPESIGTIKRHPQFIIVIRAQKIENRLAGAPEENE
jgi:hypothetical protein